MQRLTPDLVLKFSKGCKGLKKQQNSSRGPTPTHSCMSVKLNIEKPVKIPI